MNNQWDGPEVNLIQETANDHYTPTTAPKRQAETYVAWTRWQPVKGPVITHVYGPFPTRSKAQSWGRKMGRSEVDHGTADAVFDEARLTVTSREGVLSWKIHKMIDAQNEETS